MPPQNYGEDDSGVVLALAEGIKSKMEQLQLRLQTCVGNLELVSGSAGERLSRPQQSQKRQLQSEGVVENTRYCGPGVAPVPARVSEEETVQDFRRSSDASTLQDAASALRGSQISSRAVANGVAGGESWGAPGSDEVDWEDTPLGDELDDGIEMCLDDIEHLRGSGGPGHRARYATADGDAASVTPSAPSGVSVSSALQALKQNLSPHVRSSLKGGGVPTHGEELRSHYRQAVGDTVQRRLVGRADTFHTSGSLNLSPANSVGAAAADFERAVTFPREQLAVHAGGSPLLSLPVGQNARGMFKGAPEPGQTQQRHLLNRPSLKVRVEAGPGEPLQPEDGVMSPSGISRDTTEAQRPSIIARSRIPQPPMASRFSAGDANAQNSAAGSAGGAANGASASSSMSHGGASQPAGAARQRLSILCPSSPSASAAVPSPARGQHSPSVPPPARSLSKSKDQFASINSVNSTGSAGLGWKFSAAESGGVMLISYGSGAVEGDADRSAAGTPASAGPATAASPRSPFERSGIASSAAQSSGGGSAPAVGFVPPPSVGFVPPPSVGFVPPPSVGFVPPPELLPPQAVPTTSSSGGTQPPVIGFVPPPEIMGHSSGTPKPTDSANTEAPGPSVGFVLPPELRAAASGLHAGAATGSGGGAGAAAAGVRPLSLYDQVRPSLSTGSEPLDGLRPPGSTAAMTAVESVSQRADGEHVKPLGSTDQELASHIPVGDFSFGINTHVFASSKRLKLRSSAESVTGAIGRAAVSSLPSVAESREAAAAPAEAQQGQHRKEEHGRQPDSLELHSTDSGSVAGGGGGGSRRWPGPASEASTRVSGSSGAAVSAGGGLDERAFQSRAHERGYGMRERHSSDVSGGPPSEEGEAPEPLGRLPWEDSSSEAEPPDVATSGHGDGELERQKPGTQPVYGEAEGALLAPRLPSRPGSPFATAVGAAHVAHGSIPGAAGVAAGGEGDAAAPPRRVVPPPLLKVATPNGAPPLQLPPSQQEAIGVGSPDEEQSSPLPASGISGMVTSLLESSSRPAGPTRHTTGHGFSPLGSGGGSGGGATTAAATVTPAGPAPSRAHGPDLQSNLSTVLQHRFSTGGIPATSSPASQSAVSITITDADIARSGGMVPALLEIVRERFRQKGFRNLAHLAATGVGAAAVAEANSAPLSPALRAETLAERIVARVETFQTRKADDLVSALMSSELDEVPRTRGTHDGTSTPLEVHSFKSQGTSYSADTTPVVSSFGSAPPQVSSGARTNSSRIPTPIVPPTTTTTTTSTATRFAASTVALASGTRSAADGSSGRGTPRSPPSERTSALAGYMPTSSSASPSPSGAAGDTTPPQPHHAHSFHSPATGSSGWAPTRAYIAPFAAPTISPFSSAAPSPTRASAAAEAGSRPAHGPAVPAASPAGSGCSSSRKAEQATQTPLLPDASAPGDGLPSQLPLGTAQEFFLSTTVPLAARRNGAGTRGGGVYDAEDDRLLTPDSPSICTAADFFRGAASRATINTSAMAVPLRLQLPAGASTVSPFLAGGVHTPGMGVSPHGQRPRSARDVPSALHSQHDNSSVTARQRRQSASGRVSISTGGLPGRGGGGGGGRISSSGGARVMIDDAPMDMETLSSSRPNTYQPRRSAGPALAPASGAGGHTVRVAFDESSAGPAPRPYTDTGGGGGAGAGGVDGRSLTREMLMRLAHLGQEPRHAFETTTDEEREEQERQARRRARRNRSLAGQQAQGPSPRRIATGEDGTSVPDRTASMAGSSSPHGGGHSNGREHSQSAGSRSALPKQLAIVAAAEAGSGNSSPAVAAAPGDLIALPPLSLDAPDMPEPGGGDALGCATISPVGRIGAVSWSQLPHDTILIPRSRTEGAAAGAGVSSTPGTAARRAAKSVGGSAGGRAGAAAAAAGTGREAQERRSVSARGAVDSGGTRLARIGRSFTATAAATTTTTTSSCADSGLEDEDEDEEDDSTALSGAGPAAATRRLQQPHPRHPGVAVATKAGAGPSAGGRDRRDLLAPGEHTASGRGHGGVGRGTVRESAGRRGGAMEWDTEEDLPSVRFDSFEGDVDGEGEPLGGLDRGEPSPLSLSRGGVSPSSAAASVLSQRRYVAAARAHRSVSEANSAKRLSSGLLPLDDDDISGALDAEERHPVRASAAASRGRSHDRSGEGGFGADGTSDLELGVRAERRKGHKAVMAASGVQGRLRAEDDRAGSAGSAGQRRGSRTDDRESAREGPDSGPATWRAARGELPEGEGGLTANGSRIRQSLQRLLDLRTSAPSSGRTRSSSSGGSEHSSAAIPSSRHGGSGGAPHSSRAAKRRSAGGVQVTRSSGRADRGVLHHHRPSPSPSEAATAGGTTEADAVARDAPLQRGRGAQQLGDAEGQRGPTPRWRKGRPPLLGDRSAGSGASSGGDAPPADPEELMSPNYTQDMAEEEYGWDAATGDADVDNLTSPRGRRPVAASTPRGPSARRARKPPPPPLPYDPTEVPSAGVEDASHSFTRELEQQELMDAFSDLLKNPAGPPSEGSPALAEEEPSFSLDPRPTPLRPRSGGTDPPSSTSRRSSPSLVSGSWRGSPHSATTSADPGQQSTALGSTGHIAASPRGASSPGKAASATAAAVGSATTASPSNLPSWMNVILNHPRVSPEKPEAAAAMAAAAAAAVSAQPLGDLGSSERSRSGRGAEAASPPPFASPAKSSSSAHAMRTALAELLSAMRPLPATGPRADLHAPSHGPRPDTATLTTMQISLEGAGAAGALQTVAAAAAAAAAARGEPPPRAHARAAVTRDEQPTASGPSSISSSPDPELRRLLLSAWSRWYLRKSLGPEAGGGHEDKKAAAAAAAAAQARMQALAAAHSRSGSEAWDGVSQSLDLQEAANISRLHITFTRWLGHARSARRTTSIISSGGGGGGGRQRWAEPRNANTWSAASASFAASNIGPPHPAALAAPPTQSSTKAPARAPSAPPSRPNPPEAAAWPEAWRSTTSPPPPQSIGLYYGATSPRGHSSNGAAATTAMPSGPRTDGAIRGYGDGAASATRRASSGVLSTPTVSRTSGVRQVVPQQQPWQQPRQPAQHQQRPSQHPEFAHHGSLLQHHSQQHLPGQQHPTGPQASNPGQQAPSLVAAWLAGSPRQHSQPSQPNPHLTHSRPVTARSLLEQQPLATAAPAAAWAGTSGSATLTRPGTPRSSGVGRASHSMLGGVAPSTTGAAGSGSGPAGGDLESLMAMHLLEGLGAGSDGVILAGLQLATGGAFQPDKTPLRPPSPRVASGAGEPSLLTAAAGAAAAAYQSSPASARPRSASTGRMAAAPQSHGGLFAGGGQGGGIGGSILERPLLAVQQAHVGGGASPAGGSLAFSRAPVSPRVGIGTGSYVSSSGGGVPGRSGSSPRPASPRPGRASSELIGYGGSDAARRAGLLGSSSGGGSGSIDLLRAAPPSPRPASPKPGLRMGAAGSPYGAQAAHAAGLYGGSLAVRPGSSGGAARGTAGVLQAAYASPLRTGDPFYGDNIRAPDPGPDKVDLRYYGVRP